MNMPANTSLPAGTMLCNGKYIIIEVLGQGLFTTTYLGSHQALNKRVIIYEFFLKDHCFRDKDYQVRTGDIDEGAFISFRDQWFNEARILSRCSGCDEIVNILDTFEEYGTAYFVNAYIQEKDLRDYVQSQKDRRLDEKEAGIIILKIAEGLDFIHQNKILHLNLSPSNVLIDQKGSPVIIQFGIALRNIPASILKDPLTIVKPGYSPIEMYSTKDPEGPFSDIYALGGILYFLLTGKDPVPAGERAKNPSADPGLPAQGISKQSRRIIEKAMAMDPSARYRDIREMIADLKKMAPSHTKPGRRWLVPAILAIAAVIAVIVIRERVTWRSARDTLDLANKVTQVAQDNPSFSLYSSGDSLAVDDTATRDVGSFRRGPVDSVSIGKFYGLMIGVQGYTESRLATLSHTLSDIQRMADVLNKNYIFDTILIVKDPTRREIFAVMKRMAAMLEENDNFLLFYAGHGEIDVNGDQGYWLPTDAEMKNSSNWISNNDIKHFIYGLKARHILVISDACFGGSIISREAPKETELQFDPFTLQSFRLMSRTSISSSFGKPVPDRSTFLNYLINNLNSNDKAILTDEQLYNLTLESMRTGVDEDIPKPCFLPIKDVGHNDGNFIFIRKTREPSI